mgnify:CR=1 FL=1
MAEAQTIEKPEVKPQEKKVVGFATRSANKERIEQEEKELEELKKQNTGEVNEVEQEELEPTTAEERSFKKRYGDLRRHSQKKEHDFQKQIDELRTQLDASTKKQIKLPKSEEELEEWTKEYPDVAKIVETIAIKKAKEQSKDLEERLKQINTMQDDAFREKAEVELLKKHPDFITIRDMGISTKKVTAKNKSLDAAKSVATNKGNPNTSSEVSVFKESDIEKMSDREYEVNQEEITKAIQNGKFIYDLTGSAR